MKLNKLTENIYYSDYQQLTDRPSLGYVKGINFSIAIDSGHSDNHLKEFYQLLNDNNLPLPSITILTHWHWDHSFALHAINGLSIASKKTNNHLKEFIKNQNPDFEKEFKQLDPSIALEYCNNKAIIVKEADIEFENEITINLGNETVQIFESISPHSDDCTLIYLPKEKIIFIGDGTCGIFPSWQIVPIKAQAMIKVFENIDFKYAIGGHWDIQNKQEVIESLKQY